MERLLTMDEAIIKGRVMKVLRAVPEWLAVRHEDKFRTGVPDISLTSHGGTSWWEVKYTHDGVYGRAGQNATLLTLDAYGFARYLIFDAVTLHAHSVRPRYIIDPATGEFYPNTIARARANGFTIPAHVHRSKRTFDYHGVAVEMLREHLSVFNRGVFT